MIGRIHHNAEDIFTYYSTLAKEKSLPTLDDLLRQAEALVDRYSSFTAYDQAISLSETNSSSAEYRIPTGSQWNTLGTLPLPHHNTSSLKSDASKCHEEEEGFDGDRVLANSIMFMLEYGWLTELSHAVPEGDIGRVYQIFMVRILLSMIYAFSTNTAL